MDTLVAGVTGAQFLASLNKNFLRRYVMVGSIANADYTSLNAAIAAIGTIKTFYIQSEITLTANIAIPAACTIIIGAEGSLKGAYTLTGDKTALIFEGKNKAINTEVLFAGTWKTGDLDIYNFDVVADGATDDRLALQAAFNLADLTDHKSIKINGTFKVSDAVSVKNVKIKGYPKFIGTNGKTILSAAGSVGTYYAIDSDGAYNSKEVVCLNATFLASLAEGDLVNITSDLASGISAGTYQGEIFEIAELDIPNSKIISRQPLHDTYLVTDNARMAKVTPVAFSNQGQIRVEFPIHLTGDTDVDKNSIGVSVSFGRDNDLNVKAYRTGGAAVKIGRTFRPRVVFRGDLGECDGFGYGVSVFGPTMYADVTGTSHGYRHCIEHGGAECGIPWESHIHDVRAVGVYPGGGTCFDTHSSVGSVTFINCIAEGQPGTVPSAFSMNGINIKLINCEARDFFKAISIGDPTSGKRYIKNFRAINCSYGLLLSSGDDTAAHLEVDGFIHINDTAKIGGTLVFQGEITNLYVSNITGHNIDQLIYIVGTTKYPSTVVLRNISHTNDSDSNEVSIRVTGSSITTLIIDGLINRNCGQAILCENAVAFFLRNFSIENPSNVNIIKLNQAQTVVDIANGLIRTPTKANTAIINLLEGVGTLKITGVIGDGTNLDHITKVVAGKTFTNFLHCGNVITNALDAVHEAATPTNTVTSGSVGIS